MALTVEAEADAHGQHYIFRPHQRVATRNIGVVWAPGGNQTAYADVLNGWAGQLSRQPELLVRLAQRFTVFVGDLALFNAGNAAGHAAMTQAHADLVAVGCDDRVAIVGLSHGHLLGTAWAAANPAKVGALAGLIPAANLQALRVYHDSIGDIFGVRAAIDTAWGVTYPAPLPGAGDPPQNATHAETADKAAVLASQGIAWRAWAGTIDGFVPIQSVRDFAAAYGDPSALTEVEGGNHDDSTLEHVDVDELSQFIYAAVS